MGVSLFIFYDDDRIGIRFIYAILGSHLFADLRLERREFEITGLVVRDNKIYRAVAKIAYTVE